MNRDRLLGLGFAAVAVLGVPLAGVVVTDRSVLAARLSRGPLAGAVDLFRTRVDEGSLERIEGLAGLVRPAAEAAGVEPALVAAIIYAESRGRSGQTSSAGALGLMQLVPAAARDAAARAGIALPKDDVALTQALLHDDALNVSLGAAHLAWLLEHRGEWSLEAVLVSYNAGRAKLMRWIDARGSYAGWVESELGAAERGERTTGALAYARQVLRVRDRFVERGY